VKTFEFRKTVFKRWMKRRRGCDLYENYILHFTHPADASAGAGTHLHGVGRDGHIWNILILDARLTAGRGRELTRTWVWCGHQGGVTLGYECNVPAFFPPRCVPHHVKCHDKKNLRDSSGHQRVRRVLYIRKIYHIRKNEFRSRSRKSRGNISSMTIVGGYMYAG
jgi:hypothetical protein